MALNLAFAPPDPNRTDDRKVTLTLPSSVVMELKRRVAAEETTMRALVLKALADAGYGVAKGELRDRRRR